MQIERIGVCGLGKVGSVIHKVFTDSGFPTVGYDSDPERTQCHKVKTLVENTDACIFIVPTPSLPTGEFDNACLVDAFEKVTWEAKKQKRYDYIYIVSSTTTPGNCENPLRQLLAPGCAIVYKPEFIAQGSIERDLTHPDVILIGASSEWSATAVEKLYLKMVKNIPSVHRMSLTEAELAKISLNCAITMKISFANQVGMVARELGCDPNKILASVGSDHRVGPDYLHPGLPYGGPCFPRDNRMFRTVAEKCRVYAMLSMATELVNEEVKNRVLHHALKGPTPIGILGLTYKPGTDITEESLGTWLRKRLDSFVREYRAHDPMAECPNTLDEVMACPIVVIACPHPEYKDIPYPNTCEVIDPWGLLR